MSIQSYEKDQRKYRAESEKKLSDLPIDFRYYFESMKSNSEKTRLDYIRYAARFYDHCKNALHLEDTQSFDIFAKARPEDIESFLWKCNKSDRDAAQSTYNRNKNALSSLYGFMVRKHMIESNPCKEFENGDPTKKEFEKEPLTSSEVEKLMHNVHYPDELRVSVELREELEKFKEMWLSFVGVALETGSRSGGLRQMTLNDINFETHTVRVVLKGGRLHYVPISQNTEEHLKNWFNQRRGILEELGVETDRIFIKADGSDFDIQFINRRLKTFCKKNPYHQIKKNVTCHTLRHTTGTLIYKKTEDIYLVQEILGHKNISSTTIYAKMSDERKRSGLEAMTKLIYS